jgi:transmembrane sensor
MSDTALIEALEQPEPSAEPALLPAAQPAMPRRHSRDRPPQRGTPMLARRQAMAAGLAGALALPLAGYWLLHQDRKGTPSSQPLRLASTVGKRRHVVLPDGSGLLLDASSAVTVHFSEGHRRIVLDQGAARFDVRHDANRPFEVHTPLATMVALGTSFSVDHLSNASELRVFSGRVQLDAKDGRSRVFPARQWALVNGSSLQTGTFAPDARNDWQNDWLDANSMRLDFAIERLARYSSMPLKLDDPKLANLTFSGRFRLGRPVESLELIGALFGLRAERRDGAVYLVRVVRG